MATPGKPVRKAHIGCVPDDIANEHKHDMIVLRNLMRDIKCGINNPFILVKRAAFERFEVWIKKGGAELVVKLPNGELAYFNLMR